MEENSEEHLTSAAFRADSATFGSTSAEWEILRKRARSLHLILFLMVFGTVGMSVFSVRYFNQEAFRDRCFSTYQGCAEKCDYRGTMSYSGKTRPRGPWREGDWPRFSELCVEHCVIRNQCPDLPTEFERKERGQRGQLDRFFFR